MNRPAARRPSSRPGKLRLSGGLAGSIFVLVCVSVVVAAGGTASSILISKNETMFSEEGNNYSLLSSIAYSGRFIAFDSESSNIDQPVRADFYPGWNIFIMDRDSNTNVSQVFDEIDGVDAVLLTPGSNGHSRFPMLVRKDGLTPDLESRFIVFQSDSTFFDAYNWHPPVIGIDEEWDPGPYRDIFVADIGEYYANGLIYIYPVSYAADFLSGDLSDGDSGSGDSVRPGPIPTTYGGNPFHAGAVLYLDAANQPYVVFESSATNLVAGAFTSHHQIFGRAIHPEMEAYGTTSLLSRNENGIEANGHSTNPVVSSDGRFVAFVSYATNLVDGPDGSHAQVYLLDRDFDGDGRYDEYGACNLAGCVKYYLVSSNSTGEPGSGDSFSPGIGEYNLADPDTIRISFSSDAENLVGTGDRNSFRDIFLVEMNRMGEGRTIELVSLNSTGQQGNNFSTAPSISADGTVVAFTSYATNLVFNDIGLDCQEQINGIVTNLNCPDIFSRDLVHGLTWRTSLTSAGEQSHGNSGATQLDGNGKYAVFNTYANLAVDGLYNYLSQIYVRDHGTPPGNPIISPTFWRFTRVDLDETVTREFTLTMLGSLKIGSIVSVISDNQYSNHFTVINDSCSNHSFVENDICTFTVQYTTTSPADRLGDIHRSSIVINLTDDPRGALYISVEGHLEFASYSPIILTP